MFTTALIGTDDGPGGRDALALGQQLATRVVTVKAGRDVGDDLRDLAEEHDADLVVVGSSRRGGLGRLVLGDDVRDTLHASRVPVAVAPAGWAESSRPLERIGVGWADDEPSAAALELARSLDPSGAVRVVHAVLVPTRAHVTTAHGTYATAWSPAPDDAVERAQQRLDELGVDGRAVAGYCDPVLLAFAAELDLLVIGNAARGALWRWLVGSVADDLASTISCPLLVAAPVAAT